MDHNGVVVYIDGASSGNPGPSGIGVVIYNKNNLDEPIAQFAHYIGITTNNVAEYEALISALKWLLEHHFLNAEIYMDSELIYKQLNGNYCIKTPHIKNLAERARRLLNKFSVVNLKLTPRKKNRLANQLAQKIVKIKKKKKADLKK